MMKEVNCTVCNGLGWVAIPSIGEHSDKVICHGCIDCYGTGKITVPITMADRIRDMRDEQIATVLLDWYFVGHKEDLKKDRTTMYEEILKWVQSPPLV